MNSNDNSAAFHRKPFRPLSGSQPPRPFVQEGALRSEVIHIERKSFLLALKENSRGRFLRISEEVGGKRSTIIIPSTGLAEFMKLLDEMVKAGNGILAKSEPATLPQSLDSAQPVAKSVKRTMSETVRARISATLKTRWAKIKSLTR